MLVPATQLRVGMVVIHNNDLHRIMELTHVTPGNWRGFVRTKLRNLRSGLRGRSDDRERERHGQQSCQQADQFQDASSP